MRKVNDVAAAIRDGDRIIATHRGYWKHKDFWECPGRKVEENESPEEALKREIREELDTEITVGDLIDTIEYDYPEFHLSMKCYQLCLLAFLELDNNKRKKRIDELKKQNQG